MSVHCTHLQPVALGWEIRGKREEGKDIYAHKGPTAPALTYKKIKGIWVRIRKHCFAQRLRDAHG
ncbi:hypothetical protein GBAR_LOCUS20156 [Geodia barretti]|uniref:Uncharacterized protein n=1 Tax=Geodia barretti TaxID=519541 RepID=A0AA35X0Z5_GEOBA|nr:hypothetical protein GBAR_LOCUS20156 [Geodia barretti]